MEYLLTAEYEELIGTYPNIEDASTRIKEAMENGEEPDQGWHLYAAREIPFSIRVVVEAHDVVNVDLDLVDALTIKHKEGK